MSAVFITYRNTEVDDKHCLIPASCQAGDFYDLVAKKAL